MRKYLVVSPHPDDETLGAGGFILKKKSEGNKVFVLNITNMEMKYGYKSQEVEKRNIEINKMTEEYKLNGYFNLRLQPSSLDLYPQEEIIKKISKVFNEIKPDVIILPYYKDVHSDHRIIFELCYSCTKSFRYPFIKKILMMEVPSETDYAFFEYTFKPNYFVDISEHIDKKVKIAKIFESEILEHPFPRSEKNIRAYATMRGSTVGVDSAEAFMLVKAID